MGSICTKCNNALKLIICELIEIYKTVKMADPAEPTIPDYVVKLVAVGDGAVGKTCLLNVFVNSKFPKEYEPTVFENYEFNVTERMDIEEIEGKNAVAQLWDTAGQEGFERIRIVSFYVSPVRIWLLLIMWNQNGWMKYEKTV